MLLPILNNAHIKKISKKILASFRERFFYLSDRASSPRHLNLDIAHDCNLNCVMCPHKLIKTEKKNMSLEEFQYILEQFPKVKHITLQGCGETFTNPDFFKILELGKARRINFSPTTNGTILDEENIRNLEGVSNITVSIDSPIPEIYEKIRRGSNFKKVKENLRRLKKIQKKIQLCVQAIVMKDTLKDLPGLIDLAQEVGAEKVSLLNLESFNIGSEKAHASHLENANYYLEQTKRTAKEKSINLEIPSLLPEQRLCIEPWLGPRISVEGDIYPCCFIYITSDPTWPEWYQGIHRNIPQFQYKMGNIFKDSFDKIWNGETYRKLRRTIRESREHTKLSPQQLNQRRKEINLDEKFSYCKVCLYRWNCWC